MAAVRKAVAAQTVAGDSPVDAAAASVAVEGVVRRRHAREAALLEQRQREEQAAELQAVAEDVHDADKVRREDAASRLQVQGAIGDAVEQTTESVRQGSSPAARQLQTEVMRRVQQRQDKDAALLRQRQAAEVEQAVARVLQDFHADSATQELAVDAEKRRQLARLHRRLDARHARAALRGPRAAVKRGLADAPVRSLSALTNRPAHAQVEVAEGAPSAWATNAPAATRHGIGRRVIKKARAIETLLQRMIASMDLTETRQTAVSRHAPPASIGGRAFPSRVLFPMAVADATHGPGTGGSRPSRRGWQWLAESPSPSPPAPLTVPDAALASTERHRLHFVRRLVAAVPRCSKWRLKAANTLPASAPCAAGGACAVRAMLHCDPATRSLYIPVAALLQLPVGRLLTVVVHALAHVAVWETSREDAVRWNDSRPEFASMYAEALGLVPSLLFQVDSRLACTGTKEAGSAAERPVVAKIRCALGLPTRRRLVNVRTVSGRGRMGLSRTSPTALAPPALRMAAVRAPPQTTRAVAASGRRQHVFWEPDVGGGAGGMDDAAHASRRVSDTVRHRRLPSSTRHQRASTFFQGA